MGKKGKLIDIIKSIIVENRGTVSLENDKNEFKLSTYRIIRSLDDYNIAMRNGDYKKMGEEVDVLRFQLRKLKETINLLEKKI
jgi:hypothetical protein